MALVARVEAAVAGQPGHGVFGGLSAVAEALV
jgi:hypothetical protein